MIKIKKNNLLAYSVITLYVLLVSGLTLFTIQSIHVGAQGNSKNEGSVTKVDSIGQDGKGNRCGNYTDDSKNVFTKFDFGCLGREAPENTSPILDLTFAFIRFLSIGVGIIVAISIIIAGIQYSMSEGNAETTSKAKGRIRSAILALFIYIFMFSILQFIIPGGIFAYGELNNNVILTELLL